MFFMSKVIEGKFKGSKIKGGILGDVYIVVEKDGLFDTKRLYINDETIESYSFIVEYNYESEDILTNGYNNINWQDDLTFYTYNMCFVKILFKDGNESLILINGNQYLRLYSICMYNPDINKYRKVHRISENFDINKENKCPYCEQIFYGNVDYCPECKKLLNKPPRFKLLKRKHKRCIIFIYCVLFVIFLIKPFFGGELAENFLLILPMYFYLKFIFKIIEELIIRKYN